MLRQILMSLALVTACAWLQAAPLLWVEGENPAKQRDITPNSGFNAISPVAFSGDAWFSSFSEKENPAVGAAEYVVTIPEAGAYKLWARVAGTGLEVKIDGGEAIVADMKKGIDPHNTAANGNWGWPPKISWYNLGERQLTAGEHTFTFFLGGTKGNQRYAGLDCFVLTTGEFTPYGKYKPDEERPKPFQDIPAGKGWDFVPPAEKLNPAALLDLRYLNEKEAGEHGFIGLSKDGNGFVTLDDSKPIRFWGGSEYNQRDMNIDQLKAYAQFLAKRGVNVVRAHTALQPKAKDSKVTDIDEKELDQIFKLVAAMKSAGIYTVISPYWGTAATAQPNWGVMAKPGGNCSELLFFDPQMQKGYKAWLKELYNRPNPYTGVKLADEPAVAIIQIQNENSLLFWTFGNLSPEAMTYFRKLFAEWLVKKYGSLEKAQAAWKQYAPAGGELWIQADWAKGLPPISHPWDFTRDGMAKKGQWEGFTEYTSDLLEFTARLMYDFNADIVKYLRKDLGCKQLVNAGNWKGVDPVTVQDVEYWSYTSTEVVGRNYYFGGLHIGPNDGWQILPNQFYTDQSALKTPVGLPINLKQVEGHPMIIPETLWVTPSLYQSESAPLVAAQTALTGLDISFWFADGDGYWGGLRPAGKWSFAHPMGMGQFPAAALIFRQGLVREGQPAVVEHRSMRNLWERKTPIISEESSWDPNRDKENIPLNSSVKTLVDPLAFWVGPVRQVYNSDPAKSSVVDLTKYVDREKKTVRSITNELALDFDRGIYTINTPKAQAALGFLASADTQTLADVAITCKNKYASITLVSLDDKPIKESGKVLVQIGTISRPTGWTAISEPFGPEGKVHEDNLRIVATGKTPYQIEKADATVVVKNAKLTKAVSLDANGMPTAKPVKLDVAKDGVTLTVPEDTLYVVLMAE